MSVIRDEKVARCVSLRLFASGAFRFAQTKADSPNDKHNAGPKHDLRPASRGGRHLALDRHH